MNCHCRIYEPFWPGISERKSLTIGMKAITLLANIRIKMKQLFVFAILLFLATDSSAQTITWQRSYHGLGPAGFETIYSIVETADSGYIAVGNTRPGGGAGSYMMAMKISKYGDSVWFRYYESSPSAVKIIQTFDGNYVMAGVHGDLIKINDQGEIIWTSLRGNSSIRAGSILETSRKELLLTGSIGTRSYCFLMMVDSLGIHQWERTYTDYEFGGFTDVIEINGQFTLCGYDIEKIVRLLLIRINRTGEIISEHRYSKYQSTPTSLELANDDRIVLAGTGEPELNPGNSAFLMKIDTAGNVMWRKTFNPGNPEFGFCSEMISLGQKGYALIGSASYDSINILNSAGQLILADLDGNQIMQRKYRLSESNLVAHFILRTSDNGLISGGGRDEPFNYHIIKSDISGSTTKIRENGFIAHSEEFKVLPSFPNPFNSATKIRFYNNQSQVMKIEIFDITGKLLEIIANHRFQQGLVEINYSPQFLSSGIYFCKVSSSIQQETFKIVNLR